MKNLITALTTTAALLTLSITPGCQPLAKALTNDTVVTNLDQADELVGTWQFSKSDPGASYVIVLELRGDGTYTKQLKTNISVGGIHSGTWKARGTVVYLSGDGNWPPYTHDLSTFTRMR